MTKYVKLGKIVNTHGIRGELRIQSIEGYTNINDVEQFVNKMIVIDEEDLPELKEHEYYIDDIIGFDVIDDENNVVGKLKDVLAYPANDIWVVTRPNKKDLLLPNITSVILGVDYDNEHINVHILEGLDTDEN